jgi:hypothetical protein
MVFQTLEDNLRTLLDLQQATTESNVVIAEKVEEVKVTAGINNAAVLGELNLVKVANNNLGPKLDALVSLLTALGVKADVTNTKLTEANALLTIIKNKPPTQP